MPLHSRIGQERAGSGVKRALFGVNYGRLLKKLTWTCFSDTTIQFIFGSVYKKMIALIKSRVKYYS
jgi:hypothetical protein